MKITTPVDLRLAVIRRYSLELTAKSCREKMKKLRNKCEERSPEDPEVGCFENNWQASEILGKNCYSFFDDSIQDELCPKCEEYMKIRKVLVNLKLEIGNVKRAITQYAIREFKR